MDFLVPEDKHPSVLDARLAHTPLDSLKLPVETKDRLIEKMGSADVGTLYSLGAEGIAEVLGSSIEEGVHLWQAVLDLVSDPASWTVTPDIPASTAIQELHNYNLVSHLGRAIALALAGEQRSRLYTILVRRFGLNKSKEYTLEEIGNYFEITRERVRQLELKAIHILRKSFAQPPLLQEEGVDWTEICREIAVIRHIVEGRGNPIWIEDELVNLISERYSVLVNDLQRAELRVLFVVLGWKERRNVIVRGRSMHAHWVVEDALLDLTRLDGAARKTTQLLLDECIGVPYFDIKVALNKRSQEKYSDIYIRSALSLVADIEAISDDRYQIVFDGLSSAADQAYRILYEAGEPLSLRDLYRSLSSRAARQNSKIVAIRSVQGQIVGDKRFIPIGKKAWALSSWKDIVSDTVISVMRQFFLETGEPARGQAVFEYVQKRRPVERNSIQTYLADREEFVRVDRGLYQLAEWGNKRANKAPTSVRAKWNAKALTDVVIRIFRNRSLEVMPVAELVQHLRAEMEVTQVSYEALQRCPALEISVVTENPRRLQARLVSDTVGDYDFRTLRERVQEAVRAILRRQPDMSMQLQSLKKAVQKLMDVQSPTFYHYLSEMIDIQKTQITHTRETLVTLIGGEAIGTVEVADVWDRKYVYDVAISYAGNERDIARALAGSLKELDSGLRVFFDRNQLPDLVGRNLADELMLIYERNARLCVILASEAYNKSKWAQLERQSAQARQMRDKGYIVLVKLDDVPRIEGFLPTVAYLDYKDFPVDSIAAHTLKQLKQAD